MAIAATLLTACGSAPAHQSGDAVEASNQAAASSEELDPDDPCSLLTPEEVAEATDLDVDEEREVPSKPGPKGKTQQLCLYRTTPPYNFIVVSFESDVSEEDFRARMERDPSNTEEISDVGDLGFLHGGAGLSTLIGDTALSVSVQTFDSVENAALVLRKIARAGVEHLRSLRHLLQHAAEVACPQGPTAGGYPKHPLPVVARRDLGG